MTLPLREPEKFVVDPAVVAEEALPTRAPVKVVEVIFPDPSRRAIVPAVFALVAAATAVTAVLTLLAEDPPTEFTVAAEDPGPVAETSPVKAVIPAVLALKRVQSEEERHPAWLPEATAQERTGVVPPVLKSGFVAVIEEMAPGGLAQVPSPLQKVVEDAVVPLFRLVTGRFPET